MQYSISRGLNENKLSSSPIVRGHNMSKKTNGLEMPTEEYAKFMKKLRYEAYILIPKIIEHETIKKLDGEKRIYVAVDLACSVLGKKFDIDKNVLLWIIAWDSLTNMWLFEKSIRDVEEQRKMDKIDKKLMRTDPEYRKICEALEAKKQ